MNSEPEAQADAQPGGEPRPRRRWVRWTVGVAAGLVVLLVLATAAVFWILGSLDEDPVKGWLLGALDDAGVEADWDVLDLDVLDGTLHLEGLVIRTPEPWRRHAPHLLRVETLDARLDPWSVLSDTVDVGRLALRGVDAAVVRGPDGRTSLDAFLEGLPAPEEPAEPGPPPSEALLLRDLGTGVRLGSVSVEGVSFERLDVRDDRVVARLSGSGLELGGSARVASGDLRADVAVTSPEEGTRIVREGEGGGGEALLDVAVGLEIPDPSRLYLDARVDARRQTLVPDLPASGPLLRLDAETTFLPDAGRVRIALEDLEVLGDVAEASLTVDLVEDEAGRVLPMLRSGRGQVRIARTRGEEVPGWLADLPDLRDLDLGFTVEEVGLTPAGLKTGTARIEGTLGRAVVDAGGATVRADAVEVRADVATVEAGTLAVEATVGAEALDATTPDGARAEVAGLRLAVEGGSVTRDGAWETATLEGGLERLRLTTPAAEVVAEGVGLEGRAAREEGLVDVRLALPVRSLRATQAGRSLEAQDVRLEVLGDGLSAEGAPGGEATVRALLGAAEVRTPERDLRGRDVLVEVAAPVVAEPPFRGRGHAQAAELRVVPRRGPAPPALEGPRVAFTFEDVRPDAEAPTRGTGAATVTADLGPLHVEADLAKAGPEAARAVVDLRLAPLGDQVGWLPASLRRGVDLSWRRLAGDLEVQASVSRLHTPRPRVEVEVDGALRDVALRGAPLALRTSEVDLDAKVAGSEGAFEAEVRVALASPRVNRLQVKGPMTLEGKASWDARAPRLVVDLDLKAGDAPTASLDATISHDRRTRRLRYDVQADLGTLARAGLLLPADVEEAAPEATAEAVSLSLEGELAGVVRRFDGARPVLQDPLFDEVDGHHALELVVRGLDVDAGDLEATSPGIRLAVQATAEHGAVDGSVALRSDALHVASAGRELRAKGLDLRVEAASRGEVRSGVITASLDGKLASLEQNVLAGLPVEDLTLSAKAHLERLTGLRLAHFVMENPAGGTRVAVSGAMDGLRLASHVPEGWPGWDGADDVETIPGRQSLTLEGVVTQDVSRITGVVAGGARLKGDGRLSIPFEVESGDRSLYRIRAAVEAEGVDLFVPAASLEVAGLSGRVPVEQELAVGAGVEGGLQLLPLALPNTWRRVRFQDVHPFLEGESYLTADHIRWRGLKAGPVAGNLRILRNVVSLDQLQLDLDPGAVSGQVVAEYVPGASTLVFRGDVTGLLPKEGEQPLDANAALVFRPEQLDLQGRVQIVRMSKEHLRDLLDLMDPYHANPDVNQIRGALALGYPKFARARIEHGFLSAHVELGGLAKIVRLGDIRAVPVGPLLERWVAPYLPQAQGAEE